MKVKTVPEGVLENWGLPPESAQYVAHRENTVWKVKGPDRDFALRRHRPGYRSPAELRSELVWVDALAKAGIPVAQPVATLDGEILCAREDACFSLLEWIDAEAIGHLGQIRNDLDPRSLAHKIGSLIAELHHSTDEWTLPGDFTRPVWKSEELLGLEPIWGRFWENPDLTRDDSDLLIRARDKARTDLFARHEDLDQGLIHADLLTENILSRNGQLWFIDFDDSAFGYRTFDIATFFLRLCTRPDFAVLQDAVLAGYASHRRIPQDELDLFLLIRALTYPGWIIARRHEPGGIERSRRNTRLALKFAYNYLGDLP